MSENRVELRTAVPTPHFNDRQVVWRAQPVVPLDEIRSKLRHRRLWFLSAAFAIAMMLGAASALVAVQIKRMAAGRVAANAIPEVAEPEADVTAAAQVPPTQDDPTTVVEEAPAPQPTKRIATVPKSHEPLAQRPRIVGRDREPRAEVQPSEDEQLQQIRDAVLYDRWQERRARRAARRERRNQTDRDLSHVDEIFEGTRRPERRP